MQALIETFRAIGELPKGMEKDLLSAIHRITVPAHTVLQEQDKVSNKIYFVEEGIARTYYYKDGKDITYWIGLENDFVGSMASFFRRVPSNKLVGTIAPSTLWEFDYHQLEILFSTNAEMEKVGRLFGNYAIAMMEERFDNLHFHTARERYNILINNQPNIIQRVPLGMIASYLGITQETLSRIRNKL